MKKIKRVYSDQALTAPLRETIETVEGGSVVKKIEFDYSTLEQVVSEMEYDSYGKLQSETRTAGNEIYKNISHYTIDNRLDFQEHFIKSEYHGKTHYEYFLRLPASLVHLPKVLCV